MERRRPPSAPRTFIPPRTRSVASGSGHSAIDKLLCHSLSISDQTTTLCLATTAAIRKLGVMVAELNVQKIHSFLGLKHGRDWLLAPNWRSRQAALREKGAKPS